MPLTWEDAWASAATGIAAAGARAGRAIGGAVAGLFRRGRGVACCFVAGTFVATANGQVPIEEIEAGDLVWSRDPATGETLLKPVTAVIPKHEREQTSALGHGA